MYVCVPMYVHSCVHMGAPQHLYLFVLHTHTCNTYLPT